MSRAENLKQHQISKVESNKQLILDSIAEINRFGGDITVATVSQMSKNLAQIKKISGGGLTPQAIYKNKEYKTLVSKEMILTDKGKLESFKNTQKMLLDEADLRMDHFEQKLKIIQLEREIKQLKNVLLHFGEPQNTQGTSNDTTYNDNGKKAIEMIKKDLEIVLKTLKLKKLLEIDKETQNLKLVMHGDLLLEHKSAVAYYGEGFIDELNNIKESYVF
ncbi:hypothetical protein N5915_02630 [Arcobacter lacus]|uniref:hypothetical protein n=1 Tax=Arcobacter lacus TaxID=1912876 RepID=UPI0021BAE0D9|nr:hypothetical protein [Arcobacter lacus]MCT7908446.1 hypothetical protein [Arcobacter lacus]